MIDPVRPHVRAETSTEQAVTMALRQALVPGVRESVAEYRSMNGDGTGRQAPGAPTWGSTKDRAPVPYASVWAGDRRAARPHVSIPRKAQ